MEDQLYRFRRYTRVFPLVPYARHTPRVGCSVVADSKSATQSSTSKPHGGGSSVKILALLCSKQPPQQKTETSTKTELSDLAIPRRKRSRDSVEEKEVPLTGRPIDTAAPASVGTAFSTCTDPAASESSPDGSERKLSLRATEALEHVQADESTIPSPMTVLEANRANDSSTPAQSHLYVRVQYDRALITTLPIEVMRKQHPQVLIDYLLSMSVWA